MRVKERDYSGKQVFVGIDVHKKTYAVVARCGGVTVKKWSAKAGPQELAEQLGRYFDGAEIKAAYEAGFSGFRLHRILVAAGIKNIVVNAASIEVASNDRVKTDKRDALKIAEQLEAGRLNGIYVPSLEEEARRSLTRGREQVVERRKSIGNQLKMKLHYLGFAFEEAGRVCEQFLKWVEELEMASDHRFAIAELIDAWRQETRRIKRFDEAMKIQAANDPREEIYRSAPGVGPISARVLSNELGDMGRFDNERELFSYVGLTPCEYSSGESTRKGHISRQGSGRIRGLITEAAWRAIGEDASLKAFYARICLRRGGKRAIVAVARKMIGRLRHCLQHETRWQVQEQELVTE